MKEEKLDERLFRGFNFKETFLKLTERTVRYGQEHEIKHLLPRRVNEDGVGNYYYRVGKGSRTMFTAHMDDASWSGTKKINHRIQGNTIGTDGNSILGADDKAGVTILLYLIYKKVPGTYYFFAGEESGMRGAKDILRLKKDWFIENFDRCVSFDRRGYGSIISRQIGKKCCSNEFVDALKKQYDSLGIPHRNDPGGIYTDSASFIGIIPECTNISVGYFHEHSSMETQDIDYLEKLGKASAKVKWEELPTVGVKSDDSYGYGDDMIWYF
jgi:putative aminopeptidase FrvX